MASRVPGAGQGPGFGGYEGWDEYRAIVAAVDRAEELPTPPEDSALAGELLSDLGNGRRLMARYGSDLVYVEEWGWGAWDGRCWRFDDGEARAQICAHRTAEAIFDEAAALPRHVEAEPAKPEVAKKDAVGEAAAAWARWDAWYRRRKRAIATVEELRDHALASTNTGKAAAMLTAAAPYLRRKHDDFDAEVFALNVANGTLRLDGARPALYAPRRGDWSTKAAPVVYDPEARCPEWERFLAEVFPERPGMVGLVQRWLGYCLTGSLAEQKAVILEGQGANGKSTMMNVVAELLGDYVQTVPVETFLHQERGKSGSGPSPDIARMVGARLVRTSEPEPGSRLSESTLKQYTGGERMVARKLHKDFFEFTPRGKLTLSVNVRPVIVGKDHGIKRRLLVLPFPRIFTREEIEARNAARPLHEVLVGESSGILNWLIEGFRLWRESGLEVPAEATQATEGYFAEMDPVGQFVREACEVTADGTGVTAASLEKASDLFAAYKRWCDAVNEEPRTQTAFGRRLNDLGIRSEKRSGVGFRSGVRLREDWAPRGPMMEEE